MAAADFVRLGALLPADADIHDLLANGAANYDLNLDPYKIKDGDTDYLQEVSSSSSSPSSSPSTRRRGRTKMTNLGHGRTELVEATRNGDEDGGGGGGGNEAEDEGYKELCVRVDVEVFCIYKKLPNELNF